MDFGAWNVCEQSLLEMNSIEAGGSVSWFDIPMMLIDGRDLICLPMPTCCQSGHFECLSSRLSYPPIYHRDARIVSKGYGLVEHVVNTQPL